MKNLIFDIYDELRDMTAMVDDRAATFLCEELLGGERIFVAGVGRLEHIGRAFVARLTALGKKIFYVRDASTPAIGSGDVLLLLAVNSDSKSMLDMAKRAYQFQAKTVAITSKDKGALGDLCKVMLVIPNRPARATASSMQNSAVAYEQLVFMILEGVIIHLQGRMNVGSDVIRASKYNLE